ncbi:monovalent cation/H+ antiporter complex subunit F [Pseudobacteriovorax antillogorgiicola]|uniref:Multicomponent K+:H+ antiporter subunit F n=1 Tax=Pseudobacteriovorax antillogorgiicola TaxID=1513793 RepID=A0A1Y6CP29_9BACT|nr:monovalent cation/H+ antiporter complex subunit F [Pseudobacteriovorax antillogorgiicola]TCS43504.1 multicomponent K+:H+ antiporter subunit F [Pseudobacteriovorax antillogorgiicola]SMF81127.1 multicomponent K+:H+ antiporter subunit F [Pseudobacteriovorax antillogorgiicola]
MMIPLYTIILSLSFICGLYRVFSGPHVLDRILGLDYLAIVGLAVTGVFYGITGDDMVLDIGLLFGLVSFLTALVFSRFIKESSNDHSKSRFHSLR